MAESQTSGATKAAGTFFFDDTCQFCIRNAEWLKRISGEALELEALPTDLENKEQKHVSAQFQFGTIQSISQSNKIQNATPIYRPIYAPIYGHLAIAEALMLSPRQSARLLGRSLKTKWLSPIARQVYKIIARNRHRL